MASNVPDVLSFVFIPTILTRTKIISNSASRTLRLQPSKPRMKRKLVVAFVMSQSYPDLILALAY